MSKDRSRSGTRARGRLPTGSLRATYALSLFRGRPLSLSTRQGRVGFTTHAWPFGLYPRSQRKLNQGLTSFQRGGIMFPCTRQDTSVLALLPGTGRLRSNAAQDRVIGSGRPAGDWWNRPVCGRPKRSSAFCVVFGPQGRRV